ncbi:MAG: hypothetical protein R3F30_15605 [Planctomycetota bacterium]
MCCHAGGFALHAARAGAREVRAFDLDEDAVALARTNAERNRLAVDVAHGDAFEVLRGLDRGAADLVVLDPPKWIDGPKQLDAGLVRYRDLNRLALERLTPGALLVTCSCSGALGEDRFLAMLRDAAPRAPAGRARWPCAAPAPTTRSPSSARRRATSRSPSSRSAREGPAGPARPLPARPRGRLRRARVAPASPRRSPARAASASRPALRTCRACCSASARRVRLAVELGRFRATDFGELLHKVRRLPWPTVLPDGAAFAVRARSRRSRLYHSGAIEERLRRGVEERIGAGPTGVDDSGLPRVEARFEDDTCEVLVELAGEPLHRRGYRLEPGAAPLREDLARALLLCSGWTPDRALLDPFCGSGTTLCEAAWMARDRAPGSAAASPSTARGCSTPRPGSERAASRPARATPRRPCPRRRPRARGPRGGSGQRPPRRRRARPRPRRGAPVAVPVARRDRAGPTPRHARHPPAVRVRASRVGPSPTSTRAWAAVSPASDRPGAWPWSSTTPDSRGASASPCARRSAARPEGCRSGPWSTPRPGP